MKLDTSPEKIDVLVEVNPLPGNLYLQGMLQGKIESVVEQLNTLKDNIIGLDYWNVEILQETRYEDTEFQLWAWRKETDYEFQVRQEKIKKTRAREHANILKRADKLEAAKVEAAANEAREREILRILKEKYPDGKL